MKRLITLILIAGSFASCEKECQCIAVVDGSRTFNNGVWVESLLLEDCEGDTQTVVVSTAVFDHNYLQPCFTAPPL